MHKQVHEIKRAPAVAGLQLKEICKPQIVLHDKTTYTTGEPLLKVWNNNFEEVNISFPFFIEIHHNKYIILFAFPFSLFK